MADKPSKAEAKINDLRGQNEVLLRKLLTKLGNSGLFNADTTKSAKEKKDDTSGRAIFQEIQRSVVTGYSKPGSSSVTGPFEFFEKYMASKEAGEGDDKAPVKAPAWYKKLIGPALLILGGLAAFVTGIMTDGPLKGFLKILSQGGIMGGLKWMGSILTKAVSGAIEGLS